MVTGFAVPREAPSFDALWSYSTGSHKLGNRHNLRLRVPGLWNLDHCRSHDVV